jgi:phosphopantetheinyl transferase
MSHLDLSTSIRWAVSVAEWQPSDVEIAQYLDLLPPDEQAKCKRFHRLVDCKRALVSRLLYRKLGSLVFGVHSLTEVPVSRTARGKPYFSRLPESAHAPNLNFNVSHEVRTTCSRLVSTPFQAHILL